MWMGKYLKEMKSDKKMGKTWEITCMLLPCCCCSLNTIILWPLPLSPPPGNPASLPHPCSSPATQAVPPSPRSMSFLQHHHPHLPCWPASTIQTGLERLNSPGPPWHPTWHGCPAPCQLGTAVSAPAIIHDDPGKDVSKRQIKNQQRKTKVKNDHCSTQLYNHGITHIWS